MSNPGALQRIIGNGNNALAAAALSASAQLPSTDLRPVSSARQGHGQVTLTGSYTGAADSRVEVEILSGTGTALRPSLPVLTGVGSGTLAALTLSPGAVPETLSLRLVTAGAAAVPAELPFFGAVLVAALAGPDGNELTLEITRDLTLTPTAYSTLSEIAPRTANLEGAQWDWGAVPAPDRRIPETAPRLALDGHPQVHRHWRTWEVDKWVYHLDPAPQAAVAPGTRVMAVSGDYTLTLSDGTDTEIYTAVTVWEALTQIQARSALVTVSGVVAEDRAPGGMAVTDIPLRTDAYAMAVDAQISSAYGIKRLDGVSVEPDAGTEIVTIERLASGLWSVSGAVSGDLGEAQTGVAYSGAVCGFTIPAAEVPVEKLGEISARVRLESREAEEVIPGICVYPVRGAAATPKTVTFTYQRRPPATCDCSTLPAPTPSATCLGLGGVDMAGLPAAHQTRLQTLLAWRAVRIAANVQVAPYGFAATHDMDVIDEVARVFQEPLPDILESASALSAWDAALTAMQAELALYDQVHDTDQVIPIKAGETKALANNPYYSSAGAADYVLIGVNTVFLCSSNDHAYRVTTLASNTAGLFAFPASPATNGSSVTINPTSITGVNAVGTITLQDVGMIKDLARPASVEMARKYRAKMDEIKVIAGIAPAFSSASSDAGACWQDDPGAAFWWADLSGEYLPAFTDQAYVSARRINGAVVGTAEFGFGMAVACAESLQEGDSITIVVRGEGLDGYAVGDRYLLPLVAATAAPFAGGAAGDPTHVWAVRGSVSGTLDDWDWDPNTPTDYADGPLGLRLAQGGIPFVVGDIWTLALEGGSYRWRRDAGAWTSGDLYGVAPNLGDGLTLTVTEGADPSFIAGDAWSWDAIATYGPGRLRQPREGRGWAWAGAVAVLDVDLGAAMPVEAILLALHTLPAGATITLAGGVLGVTDWSLTPARIEGPLLSTLPTGTTARYLRLSLANCGSAGARIGWLWAGVPWAPTAGCSSMTRVRQYAITRTGGRNAAGIYRGRGTGGRWAWDLNAGAALSAANADELLTLLDHVVAQGLEPVCLVPDYAVPAGAMLAQIDADEVSLTEEVGYDLDGQGLVSVDLPFRGLMA